MIQAATIKHCCHTDFGVSLTTGGGIDGARLSVRRYHHVADEATARRLNGGYSLGTTRRGHVVSVRADHDGRVFPTSQAAWQFALEHGYVQPYYARDWCRQHRCLHTFLGKPSPALLDAWGGRCIKGDDCEPAPTGWAMYAPDDEPQT